VYSVSWSADSKQLISASGDRTVKVSTGLQAWRFCLLACLNLRLKHVLQVRESSR
jgi:hypothetical protein